jgi:hypothetical protein
MFAFLFDQPAIAVISREARVDLEHHHRFVPWPSRRVQLLLGASLDEHVAALPLLVGRKVRLYPSSEGLIVREWPVLRGGG